MLAIPLLILFRKHPCLVMVELDGSITNFACHCLNLLRQGVRVEYLYIAIPETRRPEDGNLERELALLLCPRVFLSCLLWLLGFSKHTVLNP